MNSRVIVLLSLLIGTCVGCIIILGIEIYDLKNKMQRIINETLEDKVRGSGNRF